MVAHRRQVWICSARQCGFRSRTALALPSASGPRLSCRFAAVQAAPVSRCVLGNPLPRHRNSILTHCVHRTCCSTTYIHLCCSTLLLLQVPQTVSALVDVDVDVDVAAAFAHVCCFALASPRRSCSPLLLYARTPPAILPHLHTCTCAPACSTPTRRRGLDTVPESDRTHD
jgi:hypothetical protein